MKVSKLFDDAAHLISSRFPAPAYLRRPAVGLDLSDRSIKFVEILPQAGGFALGRYGSKEIPVGVLEGGKIVQPEVLHKIVSEFREEFGFSHAFTSIPEEKAYAFHLSLPEMKKLEIRDSIELQLEEYVPLPAAEVVFDYDLLPSPAVQRGYDVGVSVLPSELVFGYTSLFKEAGIETLAIEIEGHSLSRAFLSPGDSGTYLIVDIGKSRVVLSIVSRGVVLHTSAAFGLGGEAMTKAIERAMNVSPAEAEKLKISSGLSRSENEKDLLDAVLPIMSSFRDEINKLLSYWVSHREGNMKQIDEVILCGGQATLPGLVNYLSADLSIPVGVANPWKNIYDLNLAVPPIDLNESLRYATAIGLALRNYSEILNQHHD